MYLQVLDGPASGVTLELDRPRTIGRDPGCDVVLDTDERVSRRHAELRAGADGTVTVTDLGSTNGVFVDGLRITEPAVVRSGTQVRIGRTNIGIRATDPARPGGAATVIGAGTVVPEVVAAPPAVVAPPATPAGPVGPASTRRGSRWRSKGVLVGGAAVLVALAVGLTAVLVLGGGDEEDALDAREITTRFGNGVLQVQTEIDGQRQGTGTAWVYDAGDGYLVTNHHVVNSGTRFTVGTGGTRRPATLVGAAPCDDLAVLRVDGVDDLLQLELGAQADITNGDDVVALGYPGTASETPTLITSSGVVSAPRSSFDVEAVDVPRYPNVVLTQTPINPGSSGGPLLDVRGMVVGVNSAGSTATQNQNYAVGVDRVREVIPALAAGDSTGWNGLLLVFPETPEEVTALGYDPATLFGRAVFAIDAVPQSPAANTGIFRELAGQPIPIIGVDGVPMDGTLQGYCEVIGSKQRGDTSRLEVTDGTEVFSIEMGYA